MTDTSIRLRSLNASHAKAVRISPSGARILKRAGLVVGVIVLLVAAHTLLSKRSALLTQAQSATLATSRITGEYETALAATPSSVTATLAKADAALPATRDQAGFITDISNAAAAAGVAWSSGSQQTLTPSTSSRTTATPPVAAKTYQLSLSATGGQAQVLSFISALQQMPRAATLSSVSLTWVKTTVTATISLVVYSR
jgi:Tfp pilus assembly protein PilO